jgi:hypothetical protein
MPGESGMMPGANTTDPNYSGCERKQRLADKNIAASGSATSRSLAGHISLRIRQPRLRQLRRTAHAGIASTVRPIHARPASPVKAAGSRGGACFPGLNLFSICLGMISAGPPDLTNR